MSFALTENSKLVCAHQGALQLTASQSKLTVSGAKVLVEGDLPPAAIQNCITPSVPPPAPSVSKPCMNVTSSIGGVAAKMKVQGKGVLLEDITGLTDGIVSNVSPQQWSVQAAGETKLKAI
jgi:hypothetical protein